jgi:hypothetical protein
LEKDGVFVEVIFMRMAVVLVFYLGFGLMEITGETLGRDK